MNFLSNLLNSGILTLAADPTITNDGYWQAQGMKYIGIGIMLFVMALVSLGEALVCMEGVKGVARNPEANSKIRTTMIIGASLVETCAIYTLVLAILLIFVV